MANNRMYLHCRSCGSLFFIAKRYNDGYYTVHSEGCTMEDDLDVFFKMHTWCNGNRQDCFDLVYEFPQEYEEE